MWGYIIGTITWSIIWGCAARTIVINKGYDDEGTKYFWLGFFFAFIAVIVAACKPDNSTLFLPSQLSQIARAAEERKISRAAEERKILDEGGWKCECGRLNYHYCSSCVCGKSQREVLNRQKEAEEKAKQLVAANTNGPDKTAAQQIKEFKELYDAGIITSEEFEAKKKQLLGL